ncbi:Mitogen-activated protein kinase 17 [Dichanthelium oligosanthes]|uniref:mitogen-activated protein kinase n=1 Tax=Dichanthelium oligosanthes TaxID=888268 RepID=A0A1E5UZL2_9POAL|nr:Mitogen-activated protein kinase 17 [Dichanthelium oligosanthes]
MGGRVRSLLRWLRHRSHRVSSSSFHLTSTTTTNNNDNTTTSKDLHAHSLPHQSYAQEEQEQEQEEEGWREVVEGPESAPEGCIVIEEERGAGPRAPVRTKSLPMDPSKKESEFFTEYGEANRYQVSEVIGKGSYGVVAAAVDTQTGERVAIKKIVDVFDHVSDATRILREIKLLRLLRHPDLVEIKHIMLPPSRREFRDIYVIFELMESDLHQVIKANDDLTAEHHQFFLYQLLRGMKYIHAASVFHRDLKPKNILANADCKLKICDFGLARVSFCDTPSAIFWTDYVATRWYRAPELCGSFFSKYTPAIDIWSIGCIFAELLTGKPLFPGKNVVHQLDLMTDLLGTPPAESISKIRNEKARRYLSNMRKKPRVPFTKKFPGVDPMALHLLERLLAFDPKERPSAAEALTDPYFNGLANSEHEPIAQPIPKLEFEFEKRKLGKDDVRELIYREILEYHPQMLQEYLRGGDQSQMTFMFPRERVIGNKHGDGNAGDKTAHASVTDGISQPVLSAKSLLKSESISASKCIGEKPKHVKDEDSIMETVDETVDEVSKKIAQLKT